MELDSRGSCARISISRDGPVERLGKARQHLAAFGGYQNIVLDANATPIRNVDTRLTVTIIPGLRMVSEPFRSRGFS